MGIFDDPNYNADRYGVPDAPGTPETWKAAYEEVMGRTEAEEVLGGADGAIEKAKRILSIPLDTQPTLDMVKAAYRRLVFKVHPDHGGTDEAFNEVHAAYSLLLDELSDGE